MTNQLIGLTGYAGAGKDYTYEALKLYLKDRPVIRVALADEVRFEVQDYLNNGDHLSAVWNKPYPREIRSLLQWWGTELRRSQDEDYWVNKAAETIDGVWREFPNGALVVVTDVRFDNEAEMVRDLGGIVLEVIAPEETRRKRLGGHLPPAHASEVIDFDVDGKVKNGRTFSLPLRATQYLEGFHPKCLPCHFLYAHPIHDFGVTNDLWEAQTSVR